MYQILLTIKNESHIVILNIAFFINGIEQLI